MVITVSSERTKSSHLADKVRRNRIQPVTTEPTMPRPIPLLMLCALMLAGCSNKTSDPSLSSEKRIGNRSKSSRLLKKADSVE